jgi:hypothetical protein
MAGEMGKMPRNLNLTIEQRIASSLRPIFIKAMHIHGWRLSIEVMGVELDKSMALHH